MLTEDPGRPAGIGVAGREEDRRIDHETELGQATASTDQYFRGVRRLFVRAISDRRHIVDGRKVSGEENRIEISRVARLASFDKDAPTRPRGSSVIARH